MENVNKSQIYSWAGFLLALLGLFLPFIRVILPMYGRKSLSLVGNMGILGDYSGFMYFVSIVGIIVVLYCLYVSISALASRSGAAWATLGYFVLLVIAFFILKGRVNGAVGEFTTEYDFDFSFIRNAIRFGLASIFFLLSGICYWLASREYIRIN